MSVWKTEWNTLRLFAFHLDDATAAAISHELSRQWGSRAIVVGRDSAGKTWAANKQEATSLSTN